MNQPYKLLPQVAFSILLALSLKPRHGYEIMKQVTEDSDGKVKLGPGALYGSLKQLNEQGLVEELGDEPGQYRRRQYRLSEAGKKRLASEVAYFESTLRLAREGEG